MRTLSSGSSRLVLPTAAVALLGISLFNAPAAQAQASLRVALETKLQIFPDPGINVTADRGVPPVAAQEFYGNSFFFPDSGYDNNVSGGGITTGIITHLGTGNGPDPSSATFNLLFNPSVTLTNTTSRVLNFTFIYDVSFGAYVDANPNGGTASATERVSVNLTNTVSGPVDFLQQELITTNGLKTSDGSTVPRHLEGRGVIFPNQPATFAFITRVDTNVQYTPAVVPPAPAVTAPEPGSITLALAAGVPVVGIVRRRKARKTSH